jgi:phosphate transport system substrate-binding protein
MIRISPKKGMAAVPPTVANALDKSYPLARSLHLYTLGEPEGKVRQYVDWVLSDAGQRIMEESGYVPLKLAGASN